MSLCQCNCGQEAGVYEKTATKFDRIKGSPRKFITGHNSTASLRGTLCRFWKSGTFMNSHGYIKQLAYGHPIADADGYVMQHRLVAEKALGRVIEMKHPVHHVNRVRNDNRPANLVICESDAYHKLLHRRNLAFTATGNPLSAKCKFCKKWDLPIAGNMHVNSSSSYHRACNATYYRKLKHHRKSRAQALPDGLAKFFKPVGGA